MNGIYHHHGSTRFFTKHCYPQVAESCIASRKHRQETEDIGTDALVVDAHRHLVEKDATIDGWESPSSSQRLPIFHIWNICLGNIRYP